MSAKDRTARATIPSATAELGGENQGQVQVATRNERPHVEEKVTADLVHVLLEEDEGVHQPEDKGQ